jgi:hypothetical protein
MPQQLLDIFLSQIERVLPPEPTEEQLKDVTHQDAD